MLQVRGLFKSYPTAEGAVTAVRNISFTVRPGQFYTLLGPSGCGKTSTLRCVAGLEVPDGGEIVIADQVVYGSRPQRYVPTHRRSISMVFQSYAIWPHLNVFENVAFPLRIQKLADKVVRAKVHQALELTGLAGLERRPATRLSGGQQQRVALARALVKEAQLLLLDEPLSNLDARLRVQMRAELAQLREQLGLTCIYVTHDQEEALALSDAVAVMRNGVIVQEGSPYDIYHRSASVFVAEFIGSSNRLEGVVQEVLGPGRYGVSTPIGSFAATGDVDAAPGAPVCVIIRPEHLERVVDTSPPAGNLVQGTLLSRSLVGRLLECQVRVGGMVLRVDLPSYHGDMVPGESLTLSIPAERCMLVPPE